MGAGAWRSGPSAARRDGVRGRWLIAVCVRLLMCAVGFVGVAASGQALPGSASAPAGQAGPRVHRIAGSLRL